MMYSDPDLFDMNETLLIKEDPISFIHDWCTNNHVSQPLYKTTFEGNKFKTIISLKIGSEDFRMEGFDKTPNLSQIIAAEKLSSVLVSKGKTRREVMNLSVFSYYYCIMY